MTTFGSSDEKRSPAFGRISILKLPGFFSICSTWVFGDKFIMIGLSLSKRDFLIPDFSDYPPEILNYLPFVFQKSGIDPSKVKKVILPSKENKQFQIILKSGKSLAMEIRLSPVSA